ncbi:MAG: helix-turn-helix domain-containing protein [Acidobacteriota bacterium]
MNKEILTLEETAEYLSLSLSTVKKWAWKRSIPVCKLGEGRKAPLRVRKKALDEWLEKRTQYNLEIDSIPEKTKKAKKLTKNEDLDEFFERIKNN